MDKNIKHETYFHEEITMKTSFQPTAKCSGATRWCNPELYYSSYWTVTGSCAVHSVVKTNPYDHLQCNKAGDGAGRKLAAKQGAEMDHFEKVSETYENLEQPTKYRLAYEQDMQMNISVPNMN